MPSNETIRYIEVTDLDLNGEKVSTIHTVGESWSEPEFKHSERYRILNEAEVVEARKKFPHLFSTGQE